MDNFINNHSLRDINSTTMPHIQAGGVSMDNFYPALVQCFGIIICGYLAGRFGIVTNAETKGLGTFVSTFALPSLIFLSMVELNWTNVNWSFLLAMFISKSVVFFAVLIICLLVARPLNYARAGLLAMFCTQSNDFAIGYPIVMALYKDVHPEYASYLYVMAPISFAILNPIGLAFMEISKNIRNKEELSRNPPLCSAESMRQQRYCLGERTMFVWNTFKSLFLNPLVLMTLLGIGLAFVFPKGLPAMVASVLRVFGQSFAAPALFLSGLKIISSGSGSQRNSLGILLPCVLMLVKIFVLPLVCRQAVYTFGAGATIDATTELSTFGFLYGTFPTALAVFVYATQYNVEVELIARSLVLCTFVSAPVMFISAKMISLSNPKPVDPVHELDAFSFDISIAGAAACCWMLALLIVTKRFKRMPQRITFCMVLSQLTCCIGVILWSKLDQAKRWSLYLQFLGDCSSRLWTAFLAITLLFLQCRSLSFVQKLWPYMLIFAWGLPGLASSLLIAYLPLPSKKKNRRFQYGRVQKTIVVFVLVICFTVTVWCLVLHQRYKKRYGNNQTTSPNLPANTDGSSSSYLPLSDDDEMITTTDVPDTRSSSSSGNCSDSSSIVTQPATSTSGISMEDLDKIESVPATELRINFKTERIIYNHLISGWNSSYDFNEEQREHRVSQPLEPLESLENTTDENQKSRHIVLLIILLCSMFVGLAVSIWTLVVECLSGIFFELSFLDVFLNFGQGLIVLAVFIGDTVDLLMPFWHKIWYGANVVSLPHWSNLRPETKQICEQFRNHHLENCKKDIAKDRRWRIRVYRKVFYGSEFVSWLIEVGLSKDRMEAVHYARHLVDGRVLRHINNVYHFEDKQLLYNFCSRI
ncbi:LOW QUALITY PROTEIN: integral membrane protein GPR155-like [Drosophila grimshawi]|uniref:LOW QUALITY PROTEIN: integral membrane protein GPR155-like n=1 Tax=Drosophila grimshawi TaxID=7222 RepID=UPI001C93381C|nr:LOW QUALITY PROTEIN: integral membrane protein GPR155-like [Drosophila grimshawi]